MEYFELKAEHLTLLQAAYVSWDGSEFGAPAINCKRPYGNSYVMGDIAEILGFTGVFQENDSGDMSFSDEQIAEMTRLHEDTQTALQIVLRTQSFVPGRYVKDRYSIDWKKVEDAK